MSFMMALAMWLSGALTALANEAGLQIVNEYRAAKGRKPLRYSLRLERVARDHAREMSGRGKMTHTGANGSSVGERVSAAGYGWCFVAENVAMGPWDLAGVIKAWAGSPGHARNMRSGQAAEFGIFRAKDGYWAMVLARPCR